MPVWLWNTIFIVLGVILLCIGIDGGNSILFNFSDNDMKSREKAIKKSLIVARICDILFVLCLGATCFGVAQGIKFHTVRYTVDYTSQIYSTDNGIYSDNMESLTYIYYTEPITNKRVPIFVTEMNTAIGDTDQPYIEYRRNWCGPVYTKEVVLVMPYDGLIEES